MIRIDHYDRYLMGAMLILAISLVAHGGERHPSAPPVDPRYDGLESRLSLVEQKIRALERPDLCHCALTGVCKCPANDCDCEGCPVHNRKAADLGGVQCLFFTADWCHFCTPAKAELEASGLVGDFVSIVDADDNPDLLKKYHVDKLPTMLCINNGKVTCHFIGPTGFADNARKWMANPPTKGVHGADVSPPIKDSRIERNTRTVSASPGWHTHTCKACGTAWSHGKEAEGNPYAHNCPRCGRRETDITGSNQPRYVPQVQIQSSGGGFWQTQCSGGQCQRVWVSR